MLTFDIDVVRADTSAVVRVGGELDHYTAPRLRAQLVELATVGVLDVTVDLAGLAFIDSTGLCALVAGLKRIRAGGGELSLRSVTPRTLKLLRLTGLDSVFDVR